MVTGTCGMPALLAPPPLGVGEAVDPTFDFNTEHFPRNAKVEPPAPLLVERILAKEVELEFPEVYPHEDFMLLELSRFFLPAAPRSAWEKLTGYCHRVLQSFGIDIDAEPIGGGSHGRSGARYGPGTTSI